jgi:hypothetical protein
VLAVIFIGAAYYSLSRLEEIGRREGRLIERRRWGMNGTCKPSSRNPGNQPQQRAACLCHGSVAGLAENQFELDRSTAVRDLLNCRPIASVAILVVMYSVITNGALEQPIFAYIYLGNALYVW